MDSNEKITVKKEEDKSTSKRIQLLQEALALSVSPIIGSSPFPETNDKPKLTETSVEMTKKESPVKIANKALTSKPSPRNN